MKTYAQSESLVFYIEAKNCFLGLFFHMYYGPYMAAGTVLLPLLHKDI